MKKKFISLITALLCLFGCYGCDLTPSPTPGNESDPPIKTGYDYENGGVGQKDAYDAAYTQALLDLGDNEFTLTQLAGVDALDRKVNTVAQRKTNKYVGIFYFLWLGDGWGDVYDISKILESNAEKNISMYDTKNNPLWAVTGNSAYNASVSPMHAFHYFEEPLYGYYKSTDKWVIKKHLELLTMAGIDFLYLDFTNASDGGVNCYKAATTALLDSILEMQNAGYNVPKIVPMCCNNTQSKTTIKNVVKWVGDNYYRAANGKYKSCWFTADPTHNPSGKPLLCVYNDGTNEVMNSSEASDFWVRNVVWPNAPTHADPANGFPWMDWEQPQRNYGGIMNVSVAQHLNGTWSSEAFLASSRNNTNVLYRGRGASYTQKYAHQTDDEEMALYGINFADQWKETIRQGDDVWLATVTGWNEWVAQKYTVQSPSGNYAMFVDTFSLAFSRDAEMMRDSHGYADNYWMQLCKYVRDFKYGASGKTSNTAMWQRKTIDYATEAAWNEVQAKYKDFTGTAIARNENSVANKYVYTDNSSRNNVDYVKLCNDSENLYVFVKTKNALAAHEQGDSGWMNLYLRTGKKTGWEGYDFVVNRNPSGSTTSIESLSVGSDKTIQASGVGSAGIATGADWISYKIPLSVLKVTAADEIQLKVCDNVFANVETARNDGVGVYRFGDVMAFYTGGECAPMGRLNYAYRMAY